MQKTYQTPELSVWVANSADVITASANQADPFGSKYWEKQ